jgi:lactose/L-arabinose transport system ATP-binding protein
MNFLDAEVVSHEGKTMTVKLQSHGGVTVPLHIETETRPAGTKLSLGIRPEHFDAKGKVRMSAAIDVIENLGGVSYAYTRSDDNAPLIIELKDAGSLSEDTVLEIGFDPARAFLFDRATGIRLR